MALLKIETRPVWRAPLLSVLEPVKSCLVGDRIRHVIHSAQQCHQNRSSHSSAQSSTAAGGLTEALAPF
jgi:hypothetical protein